MAELLRHRQTKEAATDMFSLQPPRHIPTLPIPERPLTTLTAFASCGQCERYVKYVPLSDLSRCSNEGAEAELFDYLVGAHQERGWHRQPEYLRGFEIDDQLDFNRLLDRQVSRLLAL
jgi:hypothetical protein